MRHLNSYKILNDLILLSAQLAFPKECNVDNFIWPVCLRKLEKDVWTKVYFLSASTNDG